MCVYCVFIDETLPPNYTPSRKPKEVSLSIVFPRVFICVRNIRRCVSVGLCFVGADFSGAGGQIERVAEPKGRQALEETFRGRLWNEKDLIMSLCDGWQ